MHGIMYQHSTSLLSAPVPNPGKHHSQPLLLEPTPQIQRLADSSTRLRQKRGGNDRKKDLSLFPAGRGISSCIPRMEAQASTLHPQCRTQCKQVFLHTWHEKAFPLPTWKLFPQFPSGCSERQESLEVPVGTPVDCYTQRDSSMWKFFCTVHQIVV